MFIPKWILASVAGLVVAFGLLHSQEPKKGTRLDDLRKRKVALAKEYFDAQFELCRLGLQDVLAVREAAFILGRAKYEVSTSNDERLTLLKDQVKLFESITELVARRVERGSAAKLDLNIARMGLIDAEIELETFKEANPEKK